VSLFSSLLTRVRTYVGPRDLPTGTTFEDGYARQTSAPPVTQTRWYQTDLEAAIVSADAGSMRLAGRLCRALRRDGRFAGVMSTRCEGLVQLPVRFSAPESELRDKLMAALAVDFRAVFPSSELALLSADGRTLGIGVAEFVQIAGSLPVLKRLDPENLIYNWGEDRWYYSGIHGLEPVNPGDGRWVLHCPGGAVQPWTHGLWPAVGRHYIAKEHAFFYRENYCFTLANSARVAYTPPGATEGQRMGFLAKVVNWSINAVYELTPGWDIKLLESNGRGYEVFKQTIETANEEITICVAGQIVTTTGGAGFSNSAIHSTIRSDLIQADADALAATLNEQAIPVWANERFGARAAEVSPHVAWDVTPPKDLRAQADAANQAALAAKSYNELLNPIGKQVDVVELAQQHSIPVVDFVPLATDEKQPLVLAPTDLAKAVRVREARERGAGLPALGDDRDELMLSELGAPPVPEEIKEAA
jgi:hypothetical protein